MPIILEPALSADEDPREYAKLLTDVHRATLRGGRSPAVPRALIQESWNRSRRSKLRVDRVNHPRVSTGPEFAAHADELRSRLLPVLGPALESLHAIGTPLIILADAKGQVVWRHGRDGALRDADQLGLDLGAVWRESTVGTNAIGTALATRRPVQVHGAEHYCLDQHTWSCAATPILDPRSQRVLGVLDFSSDVADGHPSALAVVAMLGQHVMDALELAHQRSLEALRRQSWEFARGTRGPWIIVDRDGWVAAASGVDVGRRLNLSDSVLDSGEPAGGAWVSGLGWLRRDTLPGGWLLTRSHRSGDGSAEDARHEGRISLELTVEADGQSGSLSFSSPHGAWTRRIPRRLVQILRGIAAHPEGVTARALSVSVFGAPGHEVSIRAEISRARRRIGSVILANPYRFAGDVRVRVIEA